MQTETILSMSHQPRKPVACTLNKSWSSYGDRRKWCLYYKCVTALARVINYTPAVINYAQSVTLPIDQHVLDTNAGKQLS
jgi:hypothetical protein